MPPIPPGGIAGAFSFSGISVTSASVVSNRPAIDAAFCNALPRDLRWIDNAGLHQVDIFTLATS